MSEFVMVKRELLERNCPIAFAPNDPDVWKAREELRAVLAQEPTLREHCKQCADIVKTWPESKRDCLGKIAQEAGHVLEPLGMVVATPVVERQEPEVLGWRVNGYNFNTERFALDYSKWSEDSPPVQYLLDRESCTSPPAPVSVVLNEVRALLATTNYSASRDCHNAQVVGAACDLLDKVKELNQFPVTLDQLRAMTGEEAAKAMPIVMGHKFNDREKHTFYCICGACPGGCVAESKP